MPDLSLPAPFNRLADKDGFLGYTIKVVIYYDSNFGER